MQSQDGHALSANCGPLGHSAPDAEGNGKCRSIRTMVVFTRAALWLAP